MKTVKARDLILGDNIPKICVPIVSKKENEILNDIGGLINSVHDLIELRIDFYEYVGEISLILELLKKIRKIYYKPIIFTLRTKSDGGLTNISDDGYFEIYTHIIDSKLVDLIDIEINRNESSVSKLIELAHKNNVKVILSNHDFLKTPNKEDMLDTMLKMQLLGADISKLAVMPSSENDVLTLLSASLEMKKLKADRPYIALSMGSLGIITRVSAHIFGSCITYASLNKTSAPGQLSLENTSEIMRILQNKHYEK